MSDTVKYAIDDGDPHPALLARMGERRVDPALFCPARPRVVDVPRELYDAIWTLDAHYVRCEAGDMIVGQPADRGATLTPVITFKDILNSADIGCPTCMQNRSVGHPAAGRSI